MELSEIDLNLLLLFQRLMQERRVATVAEQMNMSQPGVSNALAKPGSPSGSAHTASGTPSSPPRN